MDLFCLCLQQIPRTRLRALKRRVRPRSTATTREVRHQKTCACPKTAAPIPALPTPIRQARRPLPFRQAFRRPTRFNRARSSNSTNNTTRSVIEICNKMYLICEHNLQVKFKKKNRQLGTNVKIARAQNLE